MLAKKNSLNNTESQQNTFKSSFINNNFVINVSSFTGTTPCPYNSLYSAIKSLEFCFSKSLSKESKIYASSLE